MRGVKIGRLHEIVNEQRNFLTTKMVGTLKSNIVCVSDEKYIQHTAVMLTSLFECNRNKKFRVFILTDGISSTIKHKLDSSLQRYQNEICYIEVNNCCFQDVRVGQWNIIMYFKLLTPRYLPMDVNRYLFLDVDMVINDDIEELYNTSLDGNVIAACEDMPDCVSIKQRLGMKQTDHYINSGVMVVDLRKWRDKEKDIPIEEFLKQVKDIIVNDQDFIALYFKDEITLLPIRWNMVTFYFNRLPKIFPKYLPDLQDAKRHPGIIHFACPIKPWFKDCQHPYKKLYKYYLQKTLWKDYSFPIFESMTKWGRTKRVIRIFLNHIGVMNDGGFNVIK